MKGLKIKAPAKKMLLAKVKDLYVNRLMSISEISNIVGKPRGSIYYYLLQAGVHPRPRETWFKDLRNEVLERKRGQMDS